MAEINWKTREEIDKEKNEPSEIERMRQENEMTALAVLELTEMIMLKGGK